MSICLFKTPPPPPPPQKKKKKKKIIDKNAVPAAIMWIEPPGGTQMLFGQGCAAEASKPVPIFKGHFGGKGYPSLGIFSQENDVFVYFSDEMGENI